MLTGHVLELVKREKQSYIFMHLRGENSMFGMLLCCGFFVHNFRLRRFITCVLIASIEYTDAITYLDI